MELPKSKYKHVYAWQTAQQSKALRGVWWFGQVLGVKMHFRDERKAALWVDKKLIAEGRDPVNILKRVNGSGS